MSAPAVAQTMPVTSATDGRCHRIADDDYTAGLVERSRADAIGRDLRGLASRTGLNV
ncbi:MAG: hypothetical protein ACRDT0_17320 [Pseudonocardiaceae bacterium]